MSASRTVSGLLEATLDSDRLVFDVGASVGTKCAIYLHHDARVVCIEPFPGAVDQLRAIYGSDDRVSIVWAALGARKGATTLHVCSGWPEISTIATHWKEGRFHEHTWDRQIEVPMTTLDALIEDYGEPAFCKIDVEGYERQILLGLTKPLRVLSFEFARESMDETAICIERLGSLGYSQFNFAYGENDELHFGDWASGTELMSEIASVEDPMAWGDVYATHELERDPEPDQARKLL